MPNHASDMAIVCTRELFAHPQQSRRILTSLTSCGAVCEKEGRTDSCSLQQCGKPAQIPAAIDSCLSNSQLHS